MSEEENAVKITRYDMESFMSCGAMDTVMEPNIEGDWVKWEDVAPFLYQPPNPPARTDPFACWDLRRIA